MVRAGPRKIREYSLEFKLTAVRLSQQPGIQVQAVAAALAFAIMGCVRSVPYPDHEGVAGLSGDQAAAQVAGCYTLRIGPWRESDGTVLHQPRVDAPAFQPPPLVRLDAEDSPVPVFGHFRLTPQPSADTGFIYGSWRGGPDSLMLEWSRKGAMEPMYVLALGRHDSRWVGQAVVSSDVVYAHPFREAEAHAVACPPLGQPPP
ncbi:MAG: hypothetical protein OEO20_16820 [Gemmatimonadota bacterium]|nr:hypothetical protein [Gemmatimonadota bacterium]MDH3479960.1 hypothetical protein [Gemmatimonadota bacterium]MDH3570316.1 hypothetical protein [Gemmatimonadota bacterium]